MILPRGYQPMRPVFVRFETTARNFCRKLAPSCWRAVGGVGAGERGKYLRGSLSRKVRATLAGAILGLFAVTVLAAPARAEQTRFWRVSDYPDFTKGTAKGVALRSDGTLVAAPEFQQFADPNVAYLLALRLDSRGRLYASGGSNAKVIRLDASGKETVVFQSQELAAQALAIDAHDNLYAGTSPDGKVYKITPEGTSSVFFDPKTKYIWALAFDREGVLYVATGDTGEVFAVTPEGHSALFYKLDEQHVRTLAFDREGNLLVGTAPSGLIIRVSIKRRAGGEPPDAGGSFVLYESEGKEVTSLAVDSQGGIYAAAIGKKASAPITPAGGPLTPAATSGAAAILIGSGFGELQAQTTSVSTIAAAPPASFTPFPGGETGSHVYRLAPDGSPELLWSSPNELVYALGFSSEGKLLLGTGNRGVVIELDTSNIFSELAKTNSHQATAFASGADGRVYLSTANPGKIFTLGPAIARQGSYESEPFDAKIFSRWGRLSWWGSKGAGDAKVVFYARSGNTSNPEKNWSQWFGPYANGQGEPAGCPPARFVQWKAEFQSGGARGSRGDALSISWVSLAYLPKNVAPVIDNIELQEPGIRIRQMVVAQPAPGVTPPVQLRMPQTNLPGQPQIVRPPIFFHPRITPPPQGFREKGWQSAVWNAHDPNDDELEFSVYYRAEGEQTWKLLKAKLHEDYYSWDSTTMPDGAYYLKIVASDSPSNPPGEALSGSRVSSRFMVDNAPPAISNLHATLGGTDAAVEFTASDPVSALERAEFSVDAGDWTLVFPLGRLSDAPEESYRIDLGALPPGEHTVSVRVFDQFENSAIAKVTFTVPAREKGGG